MQKLFNKILVPVDFTSRSKKAVEKAGDIACQYGCSIHLLHVISLSPFTAMAFAEGHMGMPYNLINNKTELEFRLEKLCTLVRTLTNDSVNVSHSILLGTWDDTIIDFAIQKKIDLILIGQKAKFSGRRKMLLNPDKIATKSNIPVITVPSNRRLTQLYSIVIPITDFLPVRKLMYGVYIAAANNTTIKLLGIENEKTSDKVKYYMIKAYNLIRDNCNVKVELETSANQNIADAVSQFSVEKSADLIILNPGTQTRMPGFLSSLLGNIIQIYSAPPVLTINPA